MDLNAYWQENKRFVTTVVLGVLVFFVALLSIASVYEDDIDAARGRVASLKRQLGESMYDAAARDLAADENERLRSAAATLAAAAGFRPREGFRLEPSAGSPSNQYLRALTRVREELLPRANRSSLELDPGLGMPELSPTRETEIERYLEALDVIETVARLAIDTRVARLEGMQVRLDPGLTSRAGLGDVERTRVELTAIGTSRALSELLAATQRPRAGRILRIDELEMVPARRREDELRLDLTLVIPRVHRAIEGAASEGSEP